MKKNKMPFEGVLKKVNQLPIAICPACGMAPEGLRLYDGDTIGGFDERLDSSRFSAAMMWGWCPICKEKIFIIDLDILPDSTKDVDFANDNCFKAKTTEYYRVHFENYMRWSLIHHRNVEHLNFAVREPQEGKPLFTEGRARWLDMHTIGPFWVRADENPWGFARNSLEKIIPLLFRLEWVGDKWFWID